MKLLLLAVLIAAISVDMVSHNCKRPLYVFISLRLTSLSIFYPGILQKAQVEIHELGR